MAALLWCLLVSLIIFVNCNFHDGDTSTDIRGVWSARYHDNHTNSERSPATSQSYHNCFEKKCRCSSTEADCSRNYGKLTFVPRLPRGIHYLSFSYNNLTSIDRKDFFQNVSKISVLGLEDNQLRYITPGVFDGMKRLNTVYLEKNRLSYEGLTPVLSIPHLQKLDLRYQELTGPVPNDLFTRHPVPQLETLYLHANNLKRVEFRAFVPLRRLRQLGLANCKIKILHTDHLPSVEEINLSQNAIMGFPHTCNGANGSSLFPRLTHLYLGQNLISSIPKEVCLPQLRLLQLERNLFTVIKTDTFAFNRFPSMIELYLHSFSNNLKIEKRAFNNPVLSKLSLMYNNIEFYKDAGADPDSFEGCDELSDLQLSHNVFGNMSDVKMRALFRPIPKLQRLFLGFCEINHITELSFVELPALTQLIMYENRLTGLPDGAFDRLTNLSVLDISNNRISRIQEAAFGKSTRRRLSHLDLSGNLLVCSCDLIWFRDWLASDVSVFNNSYTSYRCDVTHQNVTSFYLDKQACLLSRGASVYIIVTSCLLILELCLVSWLYPYWWHIRLVLYETFRGQGRDDSRRERLLSGDFRYDVFVCYDADNVEWVYRRLIPELEGRLGLRLCIHERDFRPGRHIVENIVDSVDSSKKIMMLFSKGFAQSPWCQFELNLCLSHVIENDDALTVLFLEDVPLRDLTPAMKAVLKTTTYVKWLDDPDAEVSFWALLELSLREVLPAVYDE